MIAWPNLSTQREVHSGLAEGVFFQYEAVIAAISILFLRTTVYPKAEPRLLRYFFGVLLACLAYSRKSYELVVAVEIFSYVVSAIVTTRPSRFSRTLSTLLVSILAGGMLSLLLSHAILSDRLGWLLGAITPSFVVQTLHSLFPINEIRSAYHIMQSFSDPDTLRKQVQQLFFITFHIQVGMGYLGIDFLRKEQNRRNVLIRMDLDDKTSANETKQERAHKFQRSALPFILFTALPYMLQIIGYGNINKFAFACLQQDLHRTVRLHQLFEHENHLTAMALETTVSPGAYAMSMDNVVDTAYELFNRKMFSLPKLLLLPGVMARQPMLMLQVFPFIFISDWMKASVVSFMTTHIEKLQKEIQDRKAVRNRVENFDLKNAELLQRSGSTQFTHRRWEDLTIEIQNRLVVSDLISRSKAFFAFIQRNFVFSVLIDCALASLISTGKIVAAEIFVFSRAIEDAVDMILMRSRSEAELARMETEIEKLRNLADVWDRSQNRSLLPCNVADPEHPRVVLRNLHYSRGTASARADHVEFMEGVYALTGSNGSGKSTLFRIFMSCDSNAKPIDLHSSINLLTPMEPIIEKDDIDREISCEPADASSGDEVLDEACPSGLADEEQTHVPRLSITMPSSQVTEISQSFYWPLYVRPIDWMLQEKFDPEDAELVAKLKKIASELHDLEFFQPIKGDGIEEETDEEISERTLERIHFELQEEKEDWFSDLSGGQKSKVELVRRVFMLDTCPALLLIDETMAPLDPESKSLVMKKLKSFCSKSIIIVIYHTDVGAGDSAGGKVDCVPSSDFFDKNIHLDKGIVHIRDTC